MPIKFFVLLFVLSLSPFAADQMDIENDKENEVIKLRPRDPLATGRAPLTLTNLQVHGNTQINRLKLSNDNNPNTVSSSKRDASHVPSHARGITPIGNGNENTHFYGTNTPIKNANIDDTQNVIYVWMMTKTHEDFHIKPEDIIDLSSHFVDKALPWTEDDIFSSFLRVEIFFRQLFKSKKSWLSRRLYVGLTTDMAERIQGHKQAYEDATSEAKRKKRMLNLAADSGFNVTMRKILRKSPKSLLPAYECLTARLFLYHLFGASTLVANNEAFTLVDKYWRWPKRVADLKNLQLDTVVEDIEIELFNSIIHRYAE